MIEPVIRKWWEKKRLATEKAVVERGEGRGMRNSGLQFKPPTPAQIAKYQEKVVKAFNQNHPVGTPVIYWTGAREGDGKRSKTRSEAQMLSGHTAVVWVEGHAACIALSHIATIPGEA